MDSTAAIPHVTAGETMVHQPSMRSLVTMEMYKLRRRPMTRVIFGLMFAALTVFVAIGYLVSRASENSDLEGFLLPEIIPNAFNIIVGLGSILLVVLSASLVGSEFGWGTVRTMVGSGVSRSKLLAAKLLAIVQMIVLFVFGGLISAILMSIVITVAGGHEFSSGWVDGAALGDIVQMLLATTFLLFVSAVIGFAVAAVTRSLAAGIAIGIGFTIAESILGAILMSLGGTGENISKALISTNTNTIAALNSFDRIQLADNAPSVPQALIVLILYCVALLAIAFVSFRKRDIPSGS